MVRSQGWYTLGQLWDRLYSKLPWTRPAFCESMFYRIWDSQAIHRCLENGKKVSNLGTCLVNQKFNEFLHCRIGQIFKCAKRHCESQVEIWEYVDKEWNVRCILSLFDKRITVLDTLVLWETLGNGGMYIKNFLEVRVVDQQRQVSYRDQNLDGLSQNDTGFWRLKTCPRPSTYSRYSANS